jgi:hypothetical protein
VDGSVAAMPMVATYPARAAATPSRTARPNSSAPVITWSAANEPSTTSGPCRCSSTAAASPIAAIESRGDGSASTRSVPSASSSGS